MDKVLIVDDDPKFLTLLESKLRKYTGQFEVLSATDGVKAIEVLKKEPVLLLVTDLVMPNVDGLDLWAYLNQHHPWIPCIVMTALENPELIEFKQKVDPEDVFGYMQKPFDANELAWAIIERLDRMDEGSIATGVSVSGLLLFTELEEKSCRMEVCWDKKKEGVFYFDNGVLLDAQSNGLKGEDAALDMIGWGQVDFRFRILPDSNKTRQINRPIMSMVMEGAKPRDEDAHPGGNPDDQKQASSLSISRVQADSLLSQAVRLVRRNHFQPARMMLAGLLKSNPRNAEGWLWYSRVTGNMKAIESSLNNAAKISPKDPKVIEELKKFRLAGNTVSTERIRRCPFCWSPLGETAVKCCYCKAHLSIHPKFFASQQSARRDILEEAIASYTDVIEREKNVNAQYYLAMAHLNLAQWEQALKRLTETGRLAPQNKFFSRQLQALQNHLAGKKPSAEQEAVPSREDPEPDAASQTKSKGYKILVADDSAIARKVASIALGSRGFEILEAKNGMEALARLKKDRPDLILLDVVMPGIDGYKTLSIIKDNAEFKHIPVFMLTGRDKIFDKIKGKMSGSEEYLTKPFDPEELVSKIEKYLPG